VPAREVYQRAIERGVPPERLRLLGHPIHPRFEDVRGSKAEHRKKLGLPEHATIALLMAGGEGGGKLLPTTLGWPGRTRLPPGGRHRPQRGAQAEARGGWPRRSRPR